MGLFAIKGPSTIFGKTHPVWLIYRFREIFIKQKIIAANGGRDGIIDVSGEEVIDEADIVIVDTIVDTDETE